MIANLAVSSDPPEADAASQECRLARRLTRLFRIERAGKFERWAIGTRRRLLDRRGAAIDEMLRLDAIRRAGAVRTPAELRDALAALAREVEQFRPLAEGQAARLAEELRCLHAGPPASGIRADSIGHLLGRG